MAKNGDTKVLYTERHGKLSFVLSICTVNITALWDLSLIYNLSWKHMSLWTEEMFRSHKPGRKENGKKVINVILWYQELFCAHYSLSPDRRMAEYVSYWLASLSYSYVSYWPHLSQHLKKSVSCCLGKRQHHRANSGASRTWHRSINVSFFKNKNTKIQRQIHRSVYMEPGWVNGGWKGSFYFHHIGGFAFQQVGERHLENCRKTWRYL